MDDFNKEILKIRKGWKYKREGKDYVPFIHDKIKFNINYYLTRVALFFKFNSALVLDADDLGTTVSLKAIGFDEKKIHIPNYYDKKTEYRSMKKHMKSVSAFPISIDDYVDAIINSKSTQKFRSLLLEKYQNTKYVVKPRLFGEIPSELPSRPSPFNFIYLDYCNEYQTNKNTIKKIFNSNILSDEYVFALTGSLMLKNEDYIDKLLKQIEEEVKEMSQTKVKLDQVFVYKRYHQEGLATQTIQHKNVEESDIYSKKVGMFMFFISFISSKKINYFDNMFEICTSGLCKSDIKNKQCLFHQKEGNMNKKPFCNNRITDFYLLITSQEKKYEHAVEIIKYYDLPYSNKDALFLFSINKEENWSNGILKLYQDKVINNKKQRVTILNIDDVIQSNNNEFKKHDVFNIIYKKKTYVVSIECELNNCVGISFVYENDLFYKNASKNACLFLRKSKFNIMRINYISINDRISVRYNMQTDEDAHVAYEWFDGNIIEIIENKYKIKFDDGDIEILEIEHLEWKKIDIESESDNSYYESESDDLEQLKEENEMLKNKVEMYEKEIQQNMEKNSNIAQQLKELSLLLSVKIV